MNNERKFWEAVNLLGLFFLFCHLFTSCITINHIQNPQGKSSDIDPVCGMKVDTTNALRTDYNGRIYYFDSEECQKVFLKSPEKFAVNQSPHHEDNNMSHMGWMGGTMMVAVMVLAMTSMIIFGHVR